MSSETILTLLMLVAASYVVGFCIGLVLGVTYELLRFVCMQVLPALWRLARWLIERRSVDRRVAEIQAIGAQARQEMETLTDEYLQLIMHQ